MNGLEERREKMSVCFSALLFTSAQLKRVDTQRVQLAIFFFSPSLLPARELSAGLC